MAIIKIESQCRMALDATQAIFPSCQGSPSIGYGKTERPKRQRQQREIHPASPQHEKPDHQCDNKYDDNCQRQWQQR